MKICLLAPANSIHTRKIAYSLVRDGYEVSICTFHNAELPGINVAYLPPIAPPFKKLNYILNVPRIKRVIKDMNPDILHAHYVSSYGIVSYLTGFHPLAISVWGSDIYDRPKNPLFRLFIRQALMKAEVVLSTSKTMAEQTEKFVPDREIVVTPFGIDLAEFYPIEKGSSSEFIIGTARTLHPKYGIEYLIKAFAIFLEDVPRAKLVIAGDGPQKDELVNITKSLGIEENVRFLGFIPHNELQWVMAGVDIFCMPSESESFGVAALEAQACGVPVVSSKIGGLSETVIDGKTGFLVEPKNPRAIAERLLFLYRNPAIRKNMGKEARKFVTEYYNWSENIKIIERVYDKLMA